MTTRAHQTTTNVRFGSSSLHTLNCQHDFDAMTCKISLWIFASCVSMWASPTWPFSYLWTRKVELCWNRRAVMSNRKLRNAPRTHTKRKRVHTWSGLGHTQMFPCFWRSLEVITVGVKVSEVRFEMVTSGLCTLSQANLHRERCSSGSCCTGT